MHVDEINEKGSTSLHLTAGHGKLGSMKLPISKVVDLNKMDKKGNSTLHDATEGGAVEALEFLLRKG